MPEPPPHLSADSAAWWRQLTADFTFTASELKLLQSACEAWDRQQQARAAIEQYGAVYTDRFNAPRSRPEIAVERDARLAFARLVRELCLDQATTEPGRPPRIAGRYERT